MSQPTPYSVGFNFTTYAGLHPSAPFQPAALDSELANIEDTLDGVLQNLALLQRDDGALANGIVTPDSLEQATINMMGDWNPRGVWATATNYAVRDMVTPTGGTITYVCAVAHTSGATFAADDLLGYWQPVNGVGSVAITAASISFSQTDVLLGRSAAGAGAGQEIACTAAGRALLDDASAAAQCITLGVGTTSNPTFAALTVTTLVISANTASAFVYSDASKSLVSTAAPTDGQLLIGDTGGVPVLGSLTGTANQVVVTNGAGTITLSLPQSINVGATPTFGGLQLSNLSTGSVVFVGGSSALSEDNARLVWDNTNHTLGVGHNAPAVGTSLDVLSAALMRGGVYFETTFGHYIKFNVAWFGVTLTAVGAGPPATDIAGWQGGAVGGGLFTLGRDIPLCWNSNTTTAWDGTTTQDLMLFRDGSAALAQRNGTNAQAWRIYNTYSGAGANYERFTQVWTGNTIQLLSQALGTGTVRDVVIGTSGAASLFLRTNSTNRWGVDTNGHFLGQTDNSYDIGASGATRPRNLYLGSSIKQVGGITTSGVVGSPAIVATGRSTAQVAAVASVSTFTVGASDATFEVSANVLVTTATTHNFTVTCAYTDEGNTARTLTLSFTLVAGGAFTTAVANANGTVPYMGIPQHIRCKAATAITIATTGTFTTVTYNVEGIIKQVA